MVTTPSSKNFWNRLIACQAIVSRSPTWTINLIRPTYSSKEPTFTAFIFPFVTRFFRFYEHPYTLTVSFRRILLTLRQLSHAQIIYFYFADASARTSSDTASTCRDSKLLYYRTKVIDCFIKLYYQTKENFTLNSIYL